jgi:hypothetical protein
MKHQLVAPHHGRHRRRGRDRGRGQARDRGHSAGRGAGESPAENRAAQVDAVGPRATAGAEPSWWVLVLRAVYAPFARYVDRVQDEERAYRRRHDE